MLVSPKPLFKMKLTHQGDGRVCKHESYLLAGWQEWFITFTDLGEAEWGDELGQEMVTKDGEKEASHPKPSPPQSLPGRQERNRRHLILTQGRPVHSKGLALPDTDPSRSLSALSSGWGLSHRD